MVNDNHKGSKTGDLISLLSRFGVCGQPQQFPYDGNIFAEDVAGKSAAHRCKFSRLVWLPVSLGEL